MRGIKFRAWTGKKMLFKELDDMNWYDAADTYGKVMCPSATNDCRRFKVMQFTGLKDKNRKEIYEGDILLIHDPKGIVADYKCEICWSSKELSWAFKEGERWQRPTESMWNWIIDRELEVIGNIYENPELLKEADGG